MRPTGGAVLAEDQLAEGTALRGRRTLLCQGFHSSSPSGSRAARRWQWTALGIGDYAVAAPGPSKPHSGAITGAGGTTLKHLLVWSYGSFGSCASRLSAALGAARRAASHDRAAPRRSGSDMQARCPSSRTSRPSASSPPGAGARSPPQRAARRSRPNRPAVSKPGSAARTPHLTHARRLPRREPRTQHSLQMPRQSAGGHHEPGLQHGLPRQIQNRRNRLPRLAVIVRDNQDALIAHRSKRPHLPKPPAQTVEEARATTARNDAHRAAPAPQHVGSFRHGLASEGRWRHATRTDRVLPASGMLEPPRQEVAVVEPLAQTEQIPRHRRSSAISARADNTSAPAMRRTRSWPWCSRRRWTVRRWMSWSPRTSNIASSSSMLCVLRIT